MSYNLKNIAKKMILAKFHPMDENEIFMGSPSESIAYGMSFKVYVNGYMKEPLDVLKKYKIFRGYFNPQEKNNDDEQYQVILVTDLEKTKILCSIIYIKKNCCNSDHKVINFNLNFK